MGQAKARGTFEERQAIAIERDNKIASERERIRREREAAKTPKEREKELKNKILLTQMLGMAAPYMMRIKNRR